MNWFQILVLSLLQGLTEFLPISSSGHLVLFPKLLGFGEPSVLFDVLLHIGTLFSVLFYFRQDFLKIFQGLLEKRKESYNLLFLLVIATLPAVIFGVLFEQQVETVFGSIKAVGFFFLLTALLLFSTRFAKNSKKEFNQLNWRNALFIGLFQAVSILPGVSRAGSSIVAGLWQGADRETAFRFSFYLAVPAILGAFILKGREVFGSPSLDLFQSLVGMVTAALVGYLALKILERLLKSAKLWYFGVYCLVVGVLTLLVV